MPTLVTRDHRVYAFASGMSPVERVPAGATVVFQTCDCYDGQVALDTDRPRDDQRDRSRSNPATGPVFVEGAKRGDMIVARIEKVDLAPRGLLFGNDRGHTVRAGHVIEVADGVAKLPGGIRWPVDPVVGVIGVAPPEGSIPNSTPGDHGGNLDTPDVKGGSVVYLPVFEEGGLFALGDIHALQGDGEVCGQGIEIAGEVTVQLQVMKGRIAGGPIIQTPAHWAVIASAEDLDEAVDLALLRARDFVMSFLEVKDPEAIMLLSTLADVRISQIVNPLKTVRVCIPRRLLPAV